MSVVRLSDDFNSDVWAELKCHIMKSNPEAGNQVLYMCNYCKPRRSMMPPRCVLNELQTVPIPKELYSSAGPIEQTAHPACKMLSDHC